MSPDEQRKLAGLLEAAADMVAEQRRQQSGNVAIWVWVSSVCCAMSVALSIGLSVVIVLQGQEIKSMQHRLDAEITALQQADREKSAYLAAIYARAPHLAPQQESRNANPDHP